MPAALFYPSTFFNATFTPSEAPEGPDAQMEGLIKKDSGWWVPVELCCHTNHFLIYRPARVSSSVAVLRLPYPL